MKTHKTFNYGTLIWEPEYLTAYADYFVRFVQAYTAEGIRIDALAGSGGLFRDGEMLAEVEVSNLSDRPGVAVVQIYQRAAQSRGGWHRLVGFSKVNVPAQGAVCAQIRLTRRDLTFWDGVAGQFALPADGLHIGFGTSSVDILEWIAFS